MNDSLSNSEKAEEETSHPVIDAQANQAEDNLHQTSISSSESGQAVEIAV